jgi:hypothetical protein
VHVGRVKRRQVEPVLSRFQGKRPLLSSGDTQIRHFIDSSIPQLAATAETLTRVVSVSRTSNAMEQIKQPQVLALSRLRMVGEPNRGFHCHALN